MQEEQKPLKERHADDPETARVALSATGQEQADGFDVDEETAAALATYTERYCVVYQTLSNPPEIDPEWSVES